MSEDRGMLRAVDWRELFPSLALFSAVRMALGFRALLLAAVAIVGTSAGWRLSGELFDLEQDPVLKSDIELNSKWPWDWPPLVTPLGLSPDESSSWPAVVGPDSPMVRVWETVTAPFVEVFGAGASFASFVYSMVCALWSLMVWAFFGGAITRAAAVRIAREENVSWRQLSLFVRAHWGSYVAAPLFPILGSFLLAALLAALGLLLRFSAGVLVAGIVWPLVLLLGFMMAFLLLGLFFAWPLMWVAISAEGTDAFGALSHSYSYTFQRPFHYLAYAVAASVLGAFGLVLVTLFAGWTVELAAWGISWGSGVANLEAVETLDTYGAKLVRFWTGCVQRAPLAFAFSYVWTSSTVIYFLLRRLVDATEMDEVYSPDEHERHGLPPLKTGPDGVPRVGDDANASGDEAP